MNYGVIGAGAMGLALANVLLDNNKNVLVYGRNPAKVKYLNEKHQSEYLDNIKLNEKLKAIDSLEELLNFSDALIIAVPSKEVKNIIKEINLIIKHKVLIINAAKGLEHNSKIGMQELIKLNFNKDYFLGVVSLLGPGFAKEIIRRNITLICAVSEDLKQAKLIQNDFSNDYFRVYVSDDVIGAEIGSAMKNAIAIASGILAGLGYGENSKAALITRGLVEIQRLGKILGGKSTTFLGLTGVGDLILTCNSLNSRNYSIGYEIGKTNDSLKALSSNHLTIEGYDTVKVLKELANENEIELPIINGLYRVLYLNDKPSIVINELMSRPLKEE